DDCLRMIADKSTPALERHTVACPAVRALWQVLAHGARRHPQTQLEQQFIRNALLAPRRIISGHLANEGLQVRRDWWPSSPRLPPPEHAESLAMPAEQCRGLHDD